MVCCVSQSLGDKDSWGLSEGPSYRKWNVDLIKKIMPQDFFKIAEKSFLGVWFLALAQSKNLQIVFSETNQEFW